MPGCNTTAKTLPIGKLLLLKFFVLVGVLVNSYICSQYMYNFWWEERLIQIEYFLKLDNKLLYYSFTHVNLFLARSQLYTPLLVMYSWYCTLY